MIEADMFQMMMAGIAALLLGLFLNAKVPFLKRICIPAPVTGGIIFSFVTLFLHSSFGLEIKFDATLKDVCMMMFFTSVGFQSDFTVFRTGGKLLALMVLLVGVLIFLQNIVGVSIAAALDANPLMGLAAGSITMSGGHGTAAGFTDLMQNSGLEGAGSVLMAAATFGLLSGSLLGGPMGEYLIRKFRLEVTNIGSEANLLEQLGHQGQELQSFRSYTKAVYEIFIAVGLGSLLSKALYLTGLSFPTYFGSLIVAALIRNCSEVIPGCPKLAMSEIVSIGNICLSLFLGMAMVSLRLWELSGVALPLLVILIVQVFVIAVFARFIAFPLLGKDYDAALLVSGLCGFGLGATPNAIANMSAVSAKHRYSAIPFIVIPVVGAMFVDIINVTLITLFMNMM